MRFWNQENPTEEGDYICRMDDGYIKMCHWVGCQWFDMWKPTLKGQVKEWMKIPYDTPQEIRDRKLSHLISEKP